MRLTLLAALVTAAVAQYNGTVSTSSDSTCVCTTVPCPVPGNNYIEEGGGGQGKYRYTDHQGQAVVTSAEATITKANLDQGTGTTSCTQAYSRMLDDDGVENCDAGTYTPASPDPPCAPPCALPYVCMCPCPPHAIAVVLTPFSATLLATLFPPTPRSHPGSPPWRPWQPTHQHLPTGAGREPWCIRAVRE
jgi:hypothetical protein